MTETTPTASSEAVKLVSKPDSLAVFINWPVNDAQIAACDLLDGTDFSNCKLAFLDPLEFATANGFMSPGGEISETVYISYDESDFLRYLARIKGASETLQRFLANGGLLILRSNIPKSYIKVRKRSSTGTMKYTESVVSAFFWLEDILGVYSFTYAYARTLKYLIPKSPLKQAFGKSAVRCVQTLNSVSKGKLEVVASSGSSLRSPGISRISFDSTAGQVFLIPTFVVKQEHRKLIEAFEQVAISCDSGSSRPRWLDYYEKQVRDFSPCRDMMDEVELQMEALKKQLASLMRKQERYDGLVNLLFESDEELEAAARTALEILGFTCNEPVAGRKTSAFEAYPANDKSLHIMVRTASTETGPVGSGELETLARAIEARTSAIRAKGLLIGNAARSSRPEQRDSWFDDECGQASRREDFCLMPSLVLFTIACYIMTRLDAENIEELKRSIRCDILKCDSLFVLSRRKYAI